MVERGAQNENLNSKSVMNPFDYIDQVKKEIDLFCNKTYSPSSTSKLKEDGVVGSSGAPNIFEWEYSEKWKLVVRVPEDEYQGLNSKNVFRSPKKFALTDSSTVHNLAEDLHIKATRKGYERSELAHFVLSFVQYIPYSRKGTHPKHPIETLREKKGNCIDFTILSASLLSILNFDTAVISLDNEDHAMLGIAGPFKGTSVTYERKKYYFAETTSKHSTIGSTSRDTSAVRVTPINRQ